MGAGLACWTYAGGEGTRMRDARALPASCCYTRGQHTVKEKLTYMKLTRLIFALFLAVALFAAR